MKGHIKGIAFAALAAATLSACSKSDSSPDSSAQTTSGAPTSSNATAYAPPPPQQPAAQTVYTQPPPPPAPSHLYSYEENGKYGYERAINDEDRREGIVTKPLVMYRFIGTVEGRTIIEVMPDGNQFTRLSCASPCEYVKYLTVNTFGASRSEILHITPDSILGAVFDDAQHGQLRPSVSRVDFLFPATWSVAQSEQGSPSPAPSYRAAGAAPINGINRAAIAAPTQLLPPDETIDSPASRVAATAATRTQPSFDCDKARSDAEHLICSDVELAALDRQLADLFARARAATKDPAAFKERMRTQWNYREQNCHDRECLIKWYSDQRAALEQIAATGSI